MFFACFIVLFVIFLSFTTSLWRFLSHSSHFAYPYEQFLSSWGRLKASMSSVSDYVVMLDFCSIFLHTNAVSLTKQKHSCCFYLCPDVSHGEPFLLRDSGVAGSRGLSPTALIFSFKWPSSNKRNTNFINRGSSSIDSDFFFPLVVAPYRLSLVSCGCTPKRWTYWVKKG